MKGFQNILVPVDFGEPSNHAIDLALELARRFEGNVTLLHVAWMPASYYLTYAEGLSFPLDEMETRARVMLEAATKRAKEQYPRVTSKIVTGQPWEAIVDEIRTSGADLVVIGTHGRTGISRVVLGSVAERVVRHSPAPVLTTP